MELLEQKDKNQPKPTEKDASGGDKKALVFYWKIEVEYEDAIEADPSDSAAGSDGNGLAPLQRPLLGKGNPPDAGKEKFKDEAFRSSGDRWWPINRDRERRALEAAHAPLPPRLHSTLIFRPSSQRGTGGALKAGRIRKDADEVASTSGGRSSGGDTRRPPPPA